MNGVVRVLYVDQGTVAGGIAPTLENEPFEPVRAETGVDALKRLDYESFDVLVVPDSLPRIELSWFVDRARSIQPDVAVVVYGEAGDLPPDVVTVPPEESGRQLLARIEEVIVDRNLESALERHDRLEATAFTIAHAAVTGEDADSILDTVYDRFAGSDLYQFVWVGRYDRRTAELSGERPIAGRFSPQAVTETLGVRDSDFVVEAVESGAMTVSVGDEVMRSAAAVQPDPDAGRNARHDEVAYAAVPFAWGGETHGVVLLGSSRFDAFDATERTLLGKLGATVGRGLALVRGPGADTRSDPERIKQLIEVLAHELRNPLQIASSYLEIYREDRDEDALTRVAKAHADIEEIVGAAVHMAEPGGIEETTALDVTDVALDVWGSVRQERASLTVGEPVTVEADPDLLARLLSNLIRNAIEHAGPDVNIRIGALPDERGFFVEDDGPGITEEARQTVFEWGYSTGEEHLGIGLGFVREIADLHGWEIAVSEGADGGARFEVTAGDGDAGAASTSGTDD